jgi:hypothetical protein
MGKGTQIHIKTPCDLQIKKAAARVRAAF